MIPRSKSLINLIQSRSMYYKFKRVLTPPLKEPRESPYIVGPHLKPDYVERGYITDPIKPREVNDMDYYIYEPIQVIPDESRTVKLLLIEDVEGLGVAGTIVECPHQVGVTKLLAMKKVEYATDFAIKWYKFGPKTMQSASSALSPRTARLLKNQIYNLPISKNTDVQPWHIALALRLAGCICPIEAVEKDSISECVVEGTNLVKCTIRINNHERVEVRFTYSKAVNSDET